MTGVMYLKRKGPPANRKATDEQIIELARKHGTDRNGLERIAREHTDKWDCWGNEV